MVRLCEGKLQHDEGSAGIGHPLGTLKYLLLASYQGVLAVFAHLKRRESWLGVFSYVLIIFSTFSISGVELSVAALYLLAIYHRLRSSPATHLPVWVISPFLAWVAVLFTSAVANPNILENLEQLRHHYRILLPFALLVALQFADLNRLLKVYLAFVALIALYALIQMYLGVDLFRPEGAKPIYPIIRGRLDEQIYRARGHFAGPGYLGNLMMMAGLLFLSLAIGNQHRTRYMWLAGSLIAAMGLIASFGRGAWIGACLGLVVLAFRAPRRWRFVTVTLVIAGLVLIFQSAQRGWLNPSGSAGVGYVVVASHM